LRIHEANLWLVVPEAGARAGEVVLAFACATRSGEVSGRK